MTFFFLLTIWVIVYEMADLISDVSLLIVTLYTEEAISWITTLSCSKNILVVLLLRNDLT